MVRVMTTDESASTIITVDGTLSGEGIEPVHTSCVQALSQGKPVRLHLRDVPVIDERGRTMLQKLAADGINLTANGLYSSHIVDQIQSVALNKRRRSGEPPAKSHLPEVPVL